MRFLSYLLITFCTFAPLWAQEQIIPKPVSVERHVGGAVVLNQQSRIRVDCKDEELMEAVQLMRQILQAGTHLELPIAGCDSARQAHDISIIKDDKLVAFSPEAYRIRANDAGIRIEVASSKGLINAFASMVQMLPTAFHDKEADKTQTRWQLSDRPFTILDYPRFAWRGFLLDEARYFFGVDAVKQLIDQLHLLKMNVLHWHLTDDAGWRIEIKRYPRLTSVGSKRTETELETWGSGKYSGQPVSGYYTQQQIRDIVAYAAARNIMIVPEIDIPAHSSAAAVAYPELSLKLPQEVPTSFNINTAIDPTKESSYIFYQHVFEELAELFPTPYLHMGGDEVRFDEQWVGERAIDQFITEQGLNNYEDLQRFFTIKMNQIIQKIGRRSIAWNEVLHKGKDSTAASSPELDADIVIHHWVGGDEKLKQAIKLGHLVINASSNHTYLARSYENIPLEKAYAFDPIVAGLSPDEEEQILGLSCQMWTEWTPTLARMHYQAFPRTIAYAETGWSPKQHKCYEDFKQRLNHYLHRLKVMNINHAEISTQPTD